MVLRQGESSYDLENSVKRRRQQDMLFKSPGLSQQEEKALQARLKVIQEKLTLIGSVGLRNVCEGSTIVLAALDHAVFHRQ